MMSRGSVFLPDTVYNQWLNESAGMDQDNRTFGARWPHVGSSPNF